jgi:hypothetical protein
MEKSVRSKLDSYFEEHPNDWKKVYLLRERDQPLSLDSLRLFIGKMSRFRNLHFSLPNDDHFFIYQQFLANRNGYGSDLFDYKNCCFPFMGRSSEVFVHHNLPVRTTLPILHFLYWIIASDIYQIVEQNLEEINNYVTDLIEAPILD